MEHRFLDIAFISNPDIQNGNPIRELANTVYPLRFREMFEICYIFKVYTCK